MSLSASSTLPPGRVLSCQSHVVRGFVGNRCASFALQSLGVECDVLNTLQFSNSRSPMYRSCTGSDSILSEEDMDEIIRGLRENGFLDEYTHLLTGYIGSVGAGHALARLFDEIVSREQEKLPASSTFLYICDPVMGDKGRIYVRPEIVELHRTVLIPRAYLITPNQFELEILSGESVSDVDGGLLACRLVHAMGPSVIVCTSIENEKRPEVLTLILSVASKRDSSSDNDATSESFTEQYIVDFPRFDAYFGGTGDLFTSLLCGHLALAGSSPYVVPTLVQSIEKTLSTMHGVLEDSVKSNKVELDILSRRKEFDSPTILFSMKKVEYQQSS